MGIQLTESQRAVVEDQGGSLLVSAAAGSGKTRVLVDRLFRRVLGEEQANMDDFLIITYTRAAAAELRERIAQELAGRMADRPGDRHLQR
ncbi:MAG: UvrD-helicase domain-containing protein, partial [Oscillospiraceae bacterium]|nr:UvrD-helicase domain-containing protein [Oscillospiraceae bacterium]